MPTPLTPDEWTYTWREFIGCPVFKVIESSSGQIIAILEGGEGEVKTVFTNIPHRDVKDYLDAQILELMRLQADVDNPPLIVVGGINIGPEIGF